MAKGEERGSGRGGDRTRSSGQGQGGARQSVDQGAAKSIDEGNKRPVGHVTQAN
jgi:hypothetical protein